MMYSGGKKTTKGEQQKEGSGEHERHERKKRTVNKRVELITVGKEAVGPQSLAISTLDSRGNCATIQQGVVVDHQWRSCGQSDGISIAVVQDAKVSSGA